MVVILKTMLDKIITNILEKLVLISMVKTASHLIAKDMQLKVIMIKHKIKHKNGGLVELDLTPQLSIALHCTECNGWENPENCTAVECALYPYRKYSMKAILSVEARENLARRASRNPFSKKSGDCASEGNNG